jgi:hypothetical protein
MKEEEGICMGSEEKFESGVKKIDSKTSETAK